MAKRKTQEEKDDEYFERMKDTIMEDIKRWRSPHALAGSIGRYNQTWIDRLTKLRNEIYLEWEKWFEIDLRLR